MRRDARAAPLAYLRPSRRAVAGRRVSKTERHAPRQGDVGNRTVHGLRGRPSPGGRLAPGPRRGSTAAVIRNALARAVGKRAGRPPLWSAEASNTVIFQRLPLHHSLGNRRGHGPRAPRTVVAYRAPGPRSAAGFDGSSHPQRPGTCMSRTSRPSPCSVGGTLENLYFKGFPLPWRNVNLPAELPAQSVQLVG